MYNKLILVGFLAKDPELKYLPNGTALTGFSIASNYKYGEHKETLFLECVVFGKNAEYVSKYFSKGNLALVEGRLSERSWEDNLGNKRSKMQLVVNEIKSLTKREDTGTASVKPTEITETPIDNELEPF
jgi:single-strand DNA-binding protein